MVYGRNRTLREAYDAGRGVVYVAADLPQETLARVSRVLALD